MVNCLSGRIPYNFLRPLSQKDCPKNEQDKLDPKLHPYASAIGSLMYLMICTRPDIAFAVVFKVIQENFIGWLFNGFSDI